MSYTFMARKVRPKGKCSVWVCWARLTIHIEDSRRENKFTHKVLKGRYFRERVDGLPVLYLTQVWYVGVAMAVISGGHPFQPLRQQ